MKDATLKPDGSFTIRNAGELMEVLAGSLRQSGDIVADFSEVQECDTASLQLLCAWSRTAAERGRRVRVAAFSPAIESTAAALGLSTSDLNGGDNRGL